jgi:putative ABC transport system permease protein
MEGTIHDLRFGVRTLWRNPGFALIAVVTLALGIGANVTMLSVADLVFFGDLPFRDSERVMVLWRHSQSYVHGPFSIPTYRDLQQRNRSFEYLAMYRQSSENLISGDGEPERVEALMVSAEFPQALGIEPILGRGFLPEDDRLGAGRTVMMGHALWQRRFGADPRIVGQTINVSGEPYAVIGVLPPLLGKDRLCHAFLGDLWLPVGIFFDRLPVEDRADRKLEAIGQLAPGVSARAAAADLDRISQQLSQEHPQSFGTGRLVGEALRANLAGNLRPALLILLTAVGFVLLIACSNLINLLLTRATVRGHEIAARIALGAGRFRLIRQLLIESFLLAATGSGLGVLAAHFYLNLVPSGVSSLAKIEGLRLSGFLISATIVLTLAVTVVIGLLPALEATRSARQRRIGGARGLSVRGATQQHGLRQALVASELALALVLLIGAGLMLGSLKRLQSQDPGFATDRLLTLKVVLPFSKVEQGFAWRAFFDEALTRIESLADVEAAAVTSLRPLEADAARESPIVAEDRELPLTTEMAGCSYQMVSPGFFRTLDIPLLDGRLLGSGDDENAERVMVINESLARHFWPDSSPIGKRFAFEFLGTPDEPRPQWRKIVGIVGDARIADLRSSPGFTVYVPYTQVPLWLDGQSPTMTLLVKSRREPESLVKSVRHEILEIDPHQPVFEIQSMEEVLQNQLSESRILSWLLSSFAVMALLLAMVGVYGVISFSVASRTREIGTRMAFGANPGQILGLLLKQSLAFVAAGIAVGIVAALFLTRFMSTVLFGVRAADLATYLSVVVLLATVAVLATLVPALRAMKVQPADALRWE